MNRSNVRQSIVNLSVEEQNLAAIPFAVLERRVGKKTGKLEIEGSKILPDGSEIRVVWQVQGNNDLGLPTEQDLDIFVALGVLTFRNNFEKTVSFTGREIARILGISGVHGKFYRRLKLAMDRFIPLRFRAIASTDHQEEVKWLNVFQEASFMLDRVSGRCTGAVTWTDKLIQSMDSGFFRALDASRYMELDGITAKHLYRYLAVAFEKTDVVLIDARKLARQHLGIVNPPKYLSRLMQTLEPAFEQLIRIQVMSSYHIVSAEEWNIALRRHPAYVPENRALLTHGPELCTDIQRANCEKALERAGLPAKVCARFSAAAKSPQQLYLLDRASRMIEALKAEQVLPHVAISVIRRALEAGESGDEKEFRDILDWCEIGLEICRDKRADGQTFRNAAGFLIKLIKDPAARSRLVGSRVEAEIRERIAQREQAVLRQAEEAEQRMLVLEYERFRHEAARRCFDELNEEQKRGLRKEKMEVLATQGRLERIPSNAREQEVDELILNDIARTEAPPFEKWYLRKRAQQAVLPFGEDFVRRQQAG